MNATIGVQIMLGLLWACLTAIPILIAIKRKCENLVLINLLSVLLSWTVIGWIVAMAWALWGKPTAAAIDEPH